MIKYKSIKEVYAEPMDRLMAEEKGLVRDKTNEYEEGYIVIYDDNYTSWSPKEAFENGYIKVEEND